MPIIYHSSSKEFHLYNQKISYIIEILRNEQLGNLYFGKILKDRESFHHLLELRNKGTTLHTFDDDHAFSLEHIKQEYPSFGTGDYRESAFEILQKNGSRISDFKYVSHNIYEGKKTLHPLPATYSLDPKDTTSLEITLKDEVTNTLLILHYTLFEKLPVITRHVEFIHQGDETIYLTKVMSLSLDLPDSNYDLIELTGNWARERHVKSRRLEQGITSIQSIRGNSSNTFNPFIALKRYETTEFSGEALGVSFVYSGNFLASVEVDSMDTSRISMGINPKHFSWKLKKNETFVSPEAILVYSEEGLNGMSHTFHELFLNYLMRGSWKDKASPILINNWEGTYFDFTEEKIIDMAKTAKDLGIELFVLDDGWFGKRNDDHTSLGDWYPNLEKLPHGISGLANKIHDLGLKFGLWFEPEMVSKKSDLYHDYPEYMLHTPHRKDTPGRNQHVLDYSNPKVVDHIYKMMYKVLDEAKIDYVKWDMNRSMSEVYSLAHDPSEQGMIYHKYILGVYDLYNRLTSTFPNILFESCASGGARFDPGMLYYAPQAWTSDDTDAIERLKIQYGTSYVYPLRSMGSHISACPNHQLNRSVPLSTRANVAYFGTFGYELDITKMTEEEKEVIKTQVQFMKDHRDLICFGTFYRLASPFETDTTAWMVVSKDKQAALVGYYRPLNKNNGPYTKLKLPGLDKDKLYTINDELEIYGDELMYHGLITSDASSSTKLDPNVGDYYSKLYLLK